MFAACVPKIGVVRLVIKLLFTFTVEFTDRVPPIVKLLNVPTLVICDCAAFILKGSPDPPDKPVPAIPLATRIPPPKISILKVSTTTESVGPAVFINPEPAIKAST